MADDGPAVLVVDDEEMIREVLVRQLQRLGYRPQAAASGHEAVEAMLPGRYAAALLDIGLPDIDGVETLRRLLLIPTRTLALRHGSLLACSARW